MSRPTTILGLILATALAGCAHQQAANPGYGWAFLQSPDEGPKLTYGRPSSDDVVMMIRCAPGTPRLTLSVAGLDGDAVDLASGGVESRFVAAADPTVSGEGGLLEALADADAPTLRNFRRTGDLAVVHAGKAVSIAAVDQDRPAVHAFFEACKT
ncbi:MAG: hypothetical protein JWP92_2401 [Caulobacter sp.]|nr:hypothetical protein [Caulobacter sp.]